MQLRLATLLAGASLWAACSNGAGVYGIDTGKTAAGTSSTGTGASTAIGTTSAAGIGSTAATSGATGGSSGGSTSGSGAIDGGCPELIASLYTTRPFTDCPSGLVEVMGYLDDFFDGDLISSQSPVVITDLTNPALVATPLDCGAFYFCVDAGTILSPAISGAGSYLAETLELLQAGQSLAYPPPTGIPMLLDSFLAEFTPPPGQASLDPDKASILLEVESLAASCGAPGNNAGWSFALIDDDGGVVDSDVVYYSGSSFDGYGGSTYGNGISLLYNIDPLAGEVRLVGANQGLSFYDSCGNAPGAASEGLLTLVPVVGGQLTFAPFLIGAGAASADAGSAYDAGGVFGQFFFPCMTSAECDGGMDCVSDPVASSESYFVCEAPCTSTADCPNAATACLPAVHAGTETGNTCAVNLCNGEVAGSACDSSAPGAQDGTCIPSDVGAGLLPDTALVCMPNGTASGCSALTNDSPGLSFIQTPQPRNTAFYCPAGEACEIASFTTTLGPGVCAPLCLPAADSGCTAPTICRADLLNGTGTWGFCGPPGCAGGSSEFGPCNFDSDCGCGLDCVEDPAAGKACESSCVATSQCENAATVCTSGLAHFGASTGSVCATNLCPPTARPGSPCDASSAGSNDGTCIPADASGPNGEGLDLEYCVLDGTASTCTPESNDDDPFFGGLASPQYRIPSELCPAGDGCLANATGGGSCTPLCVPGQPGCASPDVCLSQDFYSDDFNWGFCGLCQGALGSCAFDAECCDGHCDGGAFICQ